ncbi:hypothetical protein AMTR_s00105p00087170 [Amborella trichopoda]|uniref:Uncharacterized protein n=1 Tax=Amborella trichopoda TaxID=13333 RepID=W1NXQ5_AMBTC|nr:hypothetical protein AMTR_s00105p00087170 [Amborella trichopoda]
MQSLDQLPQTAQGSEIKPRSKLAGIEGVGVASSLCSAWLTRLTKGEVGVFVSQGSPQVFEAISETRHPSAPPSNEHQKAFRGVKSQDLRGL